MKAVILAAGEGTRMRPLTLETPKPLLEVLGKPLIAYTFAALPDSVTEVLVVVNYKEEQIRAFLGDLYEGKRVTYITQKTLDGTGGALWAAREHLMSEERFLVLMSDDIYRKEDVEHCAEVLNSMMLYRAQKGEKVGAVKVEDGYVTGVVEGSAEFTDVPTINTGVYCLTPDYFNVPQIPKSPQSHEFGLPQTMIAAYPRGIRAAYADFWLSLTEPKDIARAESVLSGHERT
ncbi:nucleotidyltransferase family protein [Patescibacteria group bacterium]|nr:nucleotidyltransferase family protein [Patescibacteria group bacterium]